MRYFWGNTKVPTTYFPRKHLIASRRMASVINNWARACANTPAQTSDHYSGYAMDFNGESHDQKKSRIIKQHKDAMDRAFGGRP